MLDPGRGKVKKGYFWALARDDRPWNGDAPPAVAFTYAPGRTGKHAVDILQGFNGVLQVDGYTGYNRLLDPKTNGDIRLAYCWAHARRKLHELTLSNAAPIANDGLKQINALYRIESQIRGLPADERLVVRKEKTAPKVIAFKTWLDQVRIQVSTKSPTSEALKCIAKYWDGLILFLTDGRIEMDNKSLSSRQAATAGQWSNARSAPCPEPQERPLCKP